MIRIDKMALIESIQRLGVKEGDILFIAADLLRVGYFRNGREQTYTDWMEILLKCVGNEGTLVIPSYTQTFPRWRRNSKIIFEFTSPTTSGSLSHAFQLFPGVKRSKHPTNSCFAIGKFADYILEGHDENSSSYLPYFRVVELSGKNLMIGALSDNKLAPMSMHCAQEYLQITKKHWTAGLTQSYYMMSNKKKLFTRWDVGGCTSGGYKSYGEHIIADAITFGKVGRSISCLIDCKKSFNINVQLLLHDPKFLRCNNKQCPSCYGSPIHLHPYFWIKYILRWVNRFLNHTDRLIS